MSLERIGGRKFKLEKIDTDEIRNFEKRTNNQLLDLLTENRKNRKKEMTVEEIKKYEEEVKENNEEKIKKLEEQIAEIKRTKKELNRIASVLRSRTFEPAVVDKEPTTYADRILYQSQVESAEFEALAEEEKEAMQSRRRR